MSAAVADHFDREIVPIIARRCLDCHNTSDRKGGLDLSNRTSAMEGGESGLVLVAGDPGQSLLYSKISTGEMPPDEPLSAEEQETLRTWIAAGAHWGTPAIDRFRFSSPTRGGYDWWSLQPIRRPPVPEVRQSDWPQGAIDRFVLAALETAGLTPSPPADRRTLIRRVYFDLLGLPPTPDEVAEFEADTDPQAYAQLVERLLASPAYGERWARHWLDVVRFGESQGFERNKMRENAWKYRDWVIEAFNSDLPYDQFVRLQLAGDVLAPDDPLAVIASGFLVAGPYDLTAYTDGTPSMKAFAREEELEGLVATVSQSLLGLTINCARCHDHKFDPISQREYYQFLAALAGTYHGAERESLTDAGKQAAADRSQQLQGEIEALRAQHERASARERVALTREITRRESVVRLLAGGPAHVSEAKDPGTVHVLARGDFRQPGEAVAPAGLVALAGVPRDWKLPADAPEAERRRALADWVTHPDNPLTARVMANRIWGYHFGTAIVATPNDFGFNGQPPSHPALLDWLASEFAVPSERAGLEQDAAPPWSVKHLHRLILLSATYQQSSALNHRAQEVDAGNRLLWRRSPQRLEAEALRDAVLQLSGELNPAVGGPGFRDFKISTSSQNQIYEVFDAIGAEYHRRTIYRTWVRTGTSPLLDVFDCPDPSVATPRRSVTTTPLQALTLLNNAFFEHHAQRWSERLEQFTAEPAAQVERAYLEALTRLPSEAERIIAEELVRQHGLAQLCLVLFNTNEFLYLD